MQGGVPGDVGLRVKKKFYCKRIVHTQDEIGLFMLQKTDCYGCCSCCATKAVAAGV